MVEFSLLHSDQCQGCKTIEYEQFHINGVHYRVGRPLCRSFHMTGRIRSWTYSLEDVFDMEFVNRDDFDSVEYRLYKKGLPRSKFDLLESAMHLTPVYHSSYTVYYQRDELESIALRGVNLIVPVCICGNKWPDWKEIKVLFAHRERGGGISYHVESRDRGDCCVIAWKQGQWILKGTVQARLACSDKCVTATKRRLTMQEKERLWLKKGRKLLEESRRVLRQPRGNPGHLQLATRE